MDFNCLNMKRLKIFIGFITLILLFHCSPPKQLSKSSYDQWYRESCILEFKLTAFRKCLRCGYHNNDEINSLLASDRSHVSDFRLGYENYKLADSIGKAQFSKIIADSIKLNPLWIQHLDSVDGANATSGNYVLKNCLELYTSNYLDSLAKAKIN